MARSTQLRGVSEQAGFEVERVIEFNRAGSPAWWLNAKLLKRKTFGLNQIRLLNFLTPLFRKLDSVLPFPPLSIIAILRKPSGAPAEAPQSAV